MAEMLQQRGAKEKAVEVPVDFSKGLPWGGQAQDLDPEQDAWQFSAPPPHAIYDVELALQDCTLVKYKEEDESTWFYRINIEGRITGTQEYDNIPAFLRVTTRRGRGKAISTAEGALIKLGFKDKLPKQTTPGMVAKALVAALGKGPKSKWEIDWRASYSYQDKNGNTKYKNVFNTYDDFPDTPEGGKNPEVKVTTVNGGTETIQAQLNVVHWYGKGEEVKPKAKAVSEELEIEEPTPIKANGQAAPVKKAQPKVMEEDEIVLE